MKTEKENIVINAEKENVVMAYETEDKIGVVVAHDLKNGDGDYFAKEKTLDMTENELDEMREYYEDAAESIRTYGDGREKTGYKNGAKEGFRYGFLYGALSFLLIFAAEKIRCRIAGKK